MKVVLLVTGSRALDDSVVAEAWASEKLHARIGALPQKSVVVNGGAEGPDRWSSQIAHRYGLEYREYLLDGTIRANGVEVARWAVDGKPVDDIKLERAWPLTRNRAMVTRFAVLAQDRAVKGVEVRVLALVAAWSKTHGTEHTATLADGMGLPVETITCPSPDGPFEDTEILRGPGEMTREQLRAYQDAVKALETGPVFLGIPSRWYDDAHFRCQRGHVATQFKKTDDGETCVACGTFVVLTYPEDFQHVVPGAGA